MLNSIAHISTHIFNWGDCQYSDDSKHRMEYVFLRETLFMTRLCSVKEGILT